MIFITVSAQCIDPCTAIYLHHSSLQLKIVVPDSIGYAFAELDAQYTSLCIKST